MFQIFAGCVALSHLSIIKLGKLLVEEAVKDQKQLSGRKEDCRKDTILRL
jgi:hypothetical protein